MRIGKRLSAGFGENAQKKWRAEKRGDVGDVTF
jgi:hypothetical protein